MTQYFVKWTSKSAQNQITTGSKPMSFFELSQKHDTWDEKATICLWFEKRADGL